MLITSRLQQKALSSCPTAGGELSPHQLFASAKLPGSIAHFARSAEIYGDGEPAANVYRVISGAVRVYQVFADGRRQIRDFYLPGEVFGLEAGAQYSESAEAIVSTHLLIVKRTLVMAAAETDKDVAYGLWQAMTGDLRRSQHHSLLLIMSAQERVAEFLLDMAARLGVKGILDLPMSRQDIADHLGLTIETVSRTLTQLANAATIAIERPVSRQVELRDRPALRRLSPCHNDGDRLPL